MNNVIIVCDDKNTSEKIKSNLILLRKFDSIHTADFTNGIDIIIRNNPQLIILYSNTFDEKLTEFIKTTSSYPILFITENLSDDNLLSLYDTGITHYMLLNGSQTEFLVKVMSCLRHGTEVKKFARNKEILTQIGIFKKGTDFYSTKYTPAVFKSLIKKYPQTKLTIMAIAPDIEIKNKYNLELLANILKQNLRNEDIIGFRNEKIYILLPNTNKQGALDVYNKIKDLTAEDFTISAGILEIEKNMTYDFISKKIDETLADALLAKNSAVVYEDFSTSMAMNWLDKSNKKQKNFKLFKKALIKKIETAIAPAFFQKQQIVEQRLFEVDTDQFTNEKESRFTLKKEGVCSIFEIRYPGAVKINIYTYKNVYKSQEPEYQSYNIHDVNEKLISDLLNKFIKDFNSEQ